MLFDSRCPRSLTAATRAYHAHEMWACRCGVQRSTRPKGTGGGGIWKHHRQSQREKPTSAGREQSPWVARLPSRRLGQVFATPDPTMMDDGAYWPDDSPSVRAEMRGQVQRLRATESLVAQFSASAATLQSALSALSLDPQPIAAVQDPREIAKLGVSDTFVQLGDFAENLQHQISKNVVEPLKQYHTTIGEATKAARTFDEESDALDAAHLKYLSISRDAPVETRAYAHGELVDRAAGVALSLHDARSSLNEACEMQRVVPPRALSDLLVAQLAYHQSCTRLLTSIMPNVSALLATADESERDVTAQREAASLVRDAMPQPTVREGTTILEGWLYKGAFNLSNETSTISRLKPWNKRWCPLHPYPYPVTSIHKPKTALPPCHRVPPKPLPPYCPWQVCPLGRGQALLL